jgi:hypothetical protein
LPNSTAYPDRSWLSTSSTSPPMTFRNIGEYSAGRRTARCASAGDGGHIAVGSHGASYDGVTSVHRVTRSCRTRRVDPPGHIFRNLPQGRGANPMSDAKRRSQSPERRSSQRGEDGQRRGRQVGGGRGRARDPVFGRLGLRRG